MAALTVQEWVDPAAADVDAIVTSVATAATVQTFLGAGLDGVVGAGVMDPPRNITITSDLQADHDAVAVVIDGTDIDDNVVQDTITKTDGGNVTDVGVIAFKTVTLITVPAEAGAAGLMEFGFGDLIGLEKALITRAGLAAVLQENEAGTIVTTGTFVDAAGSPPYGTYDPATVPDATNDYALYYEYDPTA